MPAGSLQTHDRAGVPSVGGVHRKTRVSLRGCRQMLTRSRLCVEAGGRGDVVRRAGGPDGGCSQSPDLTELLFFSEPGLGLCTVRTGGFHGSGA